MKWIAIPGVVLVGALAWWTLPDAQFEAVKPEVSSVEEPSSARDSAVLVGADVEPASLDPERRSEVGVQAAPPAELPNTQGFVEAFDEEGRAQLGLAGSLSVRVRGESIEVPVVEGEFAFDAPFGGVVEFESATLAGRPYRIDRDDRRQRQGIGLVVPARWIEPSLLRVIDEETGAELADVELLWTEDDDPTHPASDRSPAPEFTGRLSPIDLPEAQGIRRWWARAPGYAWGHARVDHDIGGVKALALELEARLSVLVQGQEPGEQVEVGLAAESPLGRGDWTIARTLQPGEDRAELTGFAGGELVLWARSFAPASPHLSRARARRTLEVSTSGLQEETLVLEAPRSEEEERLTVTGTLQLCSTCPNREPPLGFAPVESMKGLSSPVARMTRDPAVPRRWSFEAQGFVPGEWEARVSDVGFAQRFTVGPQGLSDLTLVLPELARITVTVGLPDGTELDEPLSLVWQLLGESGGRGSARVDRDSLVATFECCAGEVQFEIWGKGYHSEAVTLDAAPGDHRATCALQPTCELFLQLEHDGTTLTEIEDFWFGVELEHLDGGGLCRNVQIESRQPTRFEASEPGAWRVTFPRLPGYRSIPALEVDVQPGKTRRTIQVELE